MRTNFVQTICFLGMIFCLPFAMGFDGCSSQNDPVLVVVVPNGDEVSNVVVVDAATPAGNQSLVLKNGVMMSISQKLQLLALPADQREKALASGKVTDFVIHLDWTTALNAQSKLIKLNHDLPLRDTECPMFQTARSGAQCNRNFNSIHFSELYSPTILADGSTFFIDEWNGFEASFDREVSHYVAPQIVKFFVDDKGSVFLVNVDHVVSMFSHQDLETFKKTGNINLTNLGSDFVLFQTADRKVYVFAYKELQFAGKQLNSNTLYYFNSDTFQLQPVMTDTSVRILGVNQNFIQVQGDSAYFVADFIDPENSTPKTGVISISSTAVSALPIQDLSAFNIGKLMANGTEIYVQAKSKGLASSEILQIVCQRPIQTEKINCGELPSLSGYQKLDAVLTERGTLAVAVHANTKLPDSTGNDSTPKIATWALVEVPSILGAKEFGKINKTYPIQDGEISGVRFLF